MNHRDDLAWRPGFSLTAGLAAVVAVAVLSGCKPPEAKANGEGAASSGKLVTTDVTVGTGTVAEKGDTAWVLYTGTLKDGTVFDSNSTSTKEPMAFTIGAGGVIKGWDQGVPGMKVGGKRKLHIPYDLAYGEAGQGDKIPAKADLDFEVQLLYVEKPSDDPYTYEKDDVKVGTGPEAKDGDTVVFNYKGEYLNGKVFDDSEHRPKNSAPLTVKLGANEVMKGVDFTIRGMKPGGERVVTMSPKMLNNGYGGQGITGNQPTKWTYKLISVNGTKG